MRRPQSSADIHFDLIMAAFYIGAGLGVLVKYATKHYESVQRAERITGAIRTALIDRVCVNPACTVHHPESADHLDPSEQHL